MSLWQTHRNRIRKERRNEIKAPRRAEPFIPRKQHAHRVKVVSEPKPSSASDIKKARSSTDPRPPLQRISDFQKQYNPTLHPPRPVAPATRQEPIRMLNVPQVKSPVQAQKQQRRPANKYKGKDPVKKLVQNERLRNVLLGKTPKPRKDPARMVLRVAGRKEFR
ncbi:hypothetical protein E8E13_010632 [Curvularia kusanoi]|uniref:Uncharacterized protein n=1 Tax=Curvularia kusanoi TaxID=90978 RepID=A0A9P4W9C3_CURKU|nr:hypothetical protein E8E13_010632 [Curvularia kusanoi]